MKWTGGILLVLNLLMTIVISVSTSSILPDVAAAFNASSILQDVAALNAWCIPKDSCRQDKLSRISDPPDWERRNCLCDDVCTTFGDCCADAKQFDADLQKNAILRFSCENYDTNGHNLIIKTCPAGWADEQSRKDCEDEPAVWQINQDPISFMPVTSLSSGVTYRNVKCAMCHRDTPGRIPAGAEQLRFWNPRLECNSILAGNSIVNQATTESIISKVEWDEEQGMWGLRMDINGKGEEFHSCFVDPSLPEDLQPLLRSCQPSINDCASGWLDNDVREKCLSYTSYRYHWKDIYRNVHCAVCNQVPLEELNCDSIGLTFRQLSPLRGFNPSAFALLFDLKDNDGSETVGEQKSCEDGQLFDPFSRKCRQVYCTGSGQTFRNGRCLEAVPEEVTTASTSTESSATTSSTPVATSSTSTTTSPAPKPPTTSTTEFSITDDTVIFPEDDSKYNVDVDAEVFSTDPNNSSYAEINSSSTTSTSTTTETNIQPEQNETATVIEVELSTATPITSSEESTGSNETSSFDTCPKFLLSDSEVEWLENGTLYVASRQEVIDVGRFQKEENGGVLICADGVSSVAKFGPVLGWVTLAGLGLSELCLALHLLAFIASPELRNLSGRNLASLSLALFVAYGSFMTAQFLAPGTSICVGVAVSSYYFFLAAFWWTSVLAWDVWRTIRMATVQLRSSSGHQWGRFTLYSLYAWIVPALLVAATLVIEYVDVAPTPWFPSDYHPEFGRNVCWFGQRKAILVFFAAPLLCILSFNFLLFINSLCMIRNTSSKSPTSSNQRSSKKQLALYIRLALIMGFSWIAGLIAGVADVTPLWYVFVGLCSLQGVFILLAFTWNTAVSRSVRSRIVFRPNRRATYSLAAAAGDFKGDRIHRKSRHDPSDSQESQNSNLSHTTHSILSKSNNSGAYTP